MIEKVIFPVSGEDKTWGSLVNLIGVHSFLNSMGKLSIPPPSTLSNLLNGSKFIGFHNLGYPKMKTVL